MGEELLVEKGGKLFVYYILFPAKTAILGIESASTPGQRKPNIEGTSLYSTMANQFTI